MEIYYPTDCLEEDVDHFCEDCPPSEGARIRSVFFVKKSYTFIDPTSTAEWQQAIEDGNVVVIAETNGSYDGGTPNYGAGFGDVVQTYIGSSYKATYREQDLKGNYDFYQAKKRSSSWNWGFRTETLVWITDKPATVVGKTPVVDDIKGNVVWEVEVTWDSQNDPEPFTMPEGIFDGCFMTE